MFCTNKVVLFLNMKHQFRKRKNWKNKASLCVMTNNGPTCVCVCVCVCMWGLLNRGIHIQCVVCRAIMRYVPKIWRQSIVVTAKN